MTDKSVVGKIFSVYCEDFVTYVKAVIYPGEYLNVIIGPNGSGKSTLVAAIVLGLGGSPKLLSRSSNIDEYIKNGKEKATIKITIFKNAKKEKIEFSRTIDSRGKSVYSVDNIPKTQKDYLAEIAKFKIQIDNLCQFLPQDRVQDFAKMNSQEILTNTLSSVCSAELLENYEKLKQMRNDQNKSGKLLKDKLDKMKDLENRNNQLKEQIDRMNIRKQLQNEIVVCETKKKWLEYKEIKNSMGTTEQELEQASKLMEKHQKKYELAKKNVHLIVKKRDTFEANVKNEEKNLKIISQQLDALQNKTEEFEKSLSDKRSLLERKKKEIIEREKELKTEIVLLSGITADLKHAKEDIGSDDEANEKMNRFEMQLSKLKQQHKLLMDKHRDINRKLDEQFTPELQAIKKKIASIENIGDRKLKNIRDNFEQVYKAITWLRQNRHLFEGRVYEPMILELNINNSENAKYIENVVNARDLLAFTCENKQDMNTMLQHLCKDMGLKISVIHSEASDSCCYNPTDDIEKYRRIGFSSYLIDMLTGPAPILNFLCKTYGIHGILAGSKEVDNNSEKIPRHIKVYFAGTDKITNMYSKYSGEKSSMRTEISGKNLLSIGVDEREMNAHKKRLKEITNSSDQLKNQRSEIELKLNELSEQRREVYEEKKVIEKKMIIIQEKTEKIKTQKMKIERLKNEPNDITDEEEKFKTFAKRIVKELLDIEKQKIEKLKNYQKTSEAYLCLYTKLQIYKKENSNNEQKINQLKEEYDKSKVLVENIRINIQRIDEKCEKILKSIKENCQGRIPSDKNFPFSSNFASLSDDLNELNDMILEMQSRVNVLLAENQSIYDEYQARQNEIEELRKEISSKTKDTAKDVNQMELLFNQWFPQINEIIETINTSFGRFMASMNYVGEVQLFRKDDYDFESYGIQIMVKYRNDSKLQALDRFVQSGGERAVAIAVYTLSLQKMSQVPFRCVDEINQGMDANNERRVFNMLVEETSKPGHSQYFFITPKLLPNLTFSEYMTIHIVYNGSFMEDEKVFLLNK